VFPASFLAARLARSSTYAYEVLEITEEVAKIRFLKNGKEIGVSAFTHAEAKRAGLTAKKVWADYPSDLVFARAMARGIRRFAPDLLIGNAALTNEEIGADQHEPIPEAAPPAKEPGVTDRQINDLKCAREALQIDKDGWLKILAKRGVETARALTESQAKELIDKLNTLVTTKLMEERLNHEDAKQDAHRNGDLTVDVPVVGKGGEAAKGSTVKSES
jgi:hypothetical protein